MELEYVELFYDIYNCLRKKKAFFCACFGSTYTKKKKNYTECHHSAWFFAEKQLFGTYILYSYKIGYTDNKLFFFSFCIQLEDRALQCTIYRACAKIGLPEILKVEFCF